MIADEGSTMARNVLRQEEDFAGLKVSIAVIAEA
jgi:hypothetical protein